MPDRFYVRCDLALWMVFFGRERELGRLTQHLDLRHGLARAVIVSGRRRVGKSRLVEEFCRRSTLPYVVYQATRGRNPDAERRDFLRAVARSSLPGAELLSGVSVADWTQALRSIAVALSPRTPALLVLDEVPWLVERDPEFEGALQTAWDRHLSTLPLGLILVGSDVSVMTGMQAPTRAFFGRAAPMRVDPLTVADVADMTGLVSADAIDAALITGGYPEIVNAWVPGQSPLDYVAQALETPLSPLMVAGELSLLSEFPDVSRARAVLEAVGSGERSFSGIAGRAGGDTNVASGTLAPILKSLVTKGVLVADSPLSTSADTKNRRYRIADPYLRFWLRFLDRSIPLVERGRGDLVMNAVRAGWSAWRGRAVEPFVRDSVVRLVSTTDWASTVAVGGWWNRQNNPEIDLVGADRAHVARAVTFLGSIKWRTDSPFDGRDRDALVRDSAAVPGSTAQTPLVAVSRAGVVPGLDLATRWGPDDLVGAWRAG